MKIKPFVHRYLDCLMNDNMDHLFSNLKIATGGATAPRIAKLLNFATSLMDDGECYLEVGVYTGYTLISAGYGNGKRVIGIDNFDMTGVGPVDPQYVKKILENNLRTLTVNSLFIEGDFRNVNGSHFSEKVGVSFIDGRHTYDQVIENFKWLEPKLADQAVIALDDVNLNDVDFALKDWLADHKANYDLLFYAKPHFVDDAEIPVIDKFLHNGLAIVRYKRSGFF